MTSPPSPRIPAFEGRRRTFLLAFPVAYVAVAAVRAGETAPVTICAFGLALVVALVGSRMPSGATPTVVRARMATTAGLALSIATSALATRASWAAAARESALLLATVFAVRSIGAIEGDVGLAARASEALDARGRGPRAVVRASSAIAFVTWATAAVVDALAWLKVAPSLEDVAPIVAAVAAVISLFTLGATALLVGSLRRVELAAPPRALACAGVAAFAIVLAIALALVGTTRADAAAALGAAVASAGVATVARARDAEAVARRGRRFLTLALFGGPVAALAGFFVEANVAGAGFVTFLLAAFVMLIGAIAPKLEEPFLPVKGILLEALAEAKDGARDREARAAMAHALVHLRDAAATGLGPTAAPSPELWLLHPTRVITVNAAGYLQERDADLPMGIFDVALGEPHATLRVDVLRALEVRRADLRPLLAWLEHRDALFATVIAESEDPDGLLVVPAGARTEPLSLEEVRRVKLLADAFVSVCQATSAYKRHLARERELKHRIDVLEDEIARINHAMELDVGRHVLAAARLARPATVGIYSAVSRFAYDALEQRIAQGAPVVVVARAGIDPVPYVARAHLTSPRKDAPFVVVEGTSSRDHDLDRWKDPARSPLALADRGLLFIVDAAALPRDVQVLVARTVAERRPPWERAMPLDVALAVSTAAPIDALLEEGRIAPELHARIEATEPVVLPGLRDRPEDLRSIVADRLAREGLRVRGRPVGIENSAFAELVEHPWEGEDAELASLVTKLVAYTAGDVVTKRDVAACLRGHTRAPATTDDALRIASRSAPSEPPVHGAESQADDSTAPRSHEVRHK